MEIMNKIIIEEDIDNIVKCNDFSELKNKSVFITGATGLFGLWLLEFLLFLNKKYDFNISITILTRSYNNFISKFSIFSLKSFPPLNLAASFKSSIFISLSFLFSL